MTAGTCERGIESVLLVPVDPLAQSRLTAQHVLQILRASYPTDRQTLDAIMRGEHTLAGFTRSLLEQSNQVSVIGRSAMCSPPGHLSEEGIFGGLTVDETRRPGAQDVHDVGISQQGDIAAWLELEEGLPSIDMAAGHPLTLPVLSASETGITTLTSDRETPRSVSYLELFAAVGQIALVTVAHRSD